MNDPPKRDVAVFAEALQLISAERSTYLERACGADEQLRQRVERLLKATITPAPRDLEPPAKKQGSQK
jgi:hypothetical protein